jgi:hypothetical protein
MVGMTNGLELPLDCELDLSDAMLEIDGTAFDATSPPIAAGMDPADSGGVQTFDSTTSMELLFVREDRSRSLRPYLFLARSTSIPSKSLEDSTSGGRHASSFDLVGGSHAMTMAFVPPPVLSRSFLVS